MNKNFITVVWGKDYIKSFLDCAPYSFLSKGNHDGLHGGNYFFYTTKDGENQIKASSVYKKLSELCKIFFIPIGRYMDQKSNVVVEQMFKHAICVALGSGSALCSIPPDTIRSDGSISFAWNKLLQGNKAVIIPTGALRVYKKEFISELLKDKDNSPRNLTRLFFKFMHRETKDHNIKSNTFFPHPVFVSFDIEGGIVVHSFYNEPIFFVPKREMVWSNIEIDLVTKNYRPDDTYVVTDSDNIFEASLTLPDYERFYWGEGSFSPEKIINNIGDYRNDVNSEYFRRGYRVHSGDNAVSNKPEIKEVVNSVLGLSYANF